MYLNDTKATTLKGILKKCYFKAKSIFGQADFVPSAHYYSPNSKEIEECIASRNMNPDSLFWLRKL